VNADVTAGEPVDQSGQAEIGPGGQAGNRTVRNPAEAPEWVAMRAGAHARARVAALWAGVKADWPGRGLWESSPASPAEVARYAAAGEWCAPESRWRWAGLAWAYGPAALVTVVCHLVTWVVQRPGRVAALAVLAGLVWIF